MNTIIEFDGVGYRYGQSRVLQDISFEVGFKFPVFLIGKSGAGKSTILKLAYLELFPSEGSVKIDGFETRNIKNNKIPLIRRKIGVVFQDNKLLGDRTVFENLAFVLEVTRHKSQSIRKKVTDILEQVGLPHKAKYLPHTLSGGEMQRIGIARAIINDPVVLLADEPTGNLDMETSFEIIDLLKKIHASGTAVLISTHNYGIIPNEGATVLKLEQGKITRLVSAC